MKIFGLIIAAAIAGIGILATFDWETRTAEFLRWCLGALAVIVLMFWLTGCASLQWASSEGAGFSNKGAYAGRRSCFDVVGTVEKWRPCRPGEASPY